MDDELCIEIADPLSEEDEFSCPECGEELACDEVDETEVCINPECPCFGEEVFLAVSDWTERQHERRQMGVGL